MGNQSSHGLFGGSASEPGAAAADRERKPERELALHDVPFVGDFSQPSVVPEDAFPRVEELMRSGRLFRYCGKGGAQGSDVSVAETMVAEWCGKKYAIGVNSCSSAIYLALQCAGVRHGDEVFTNGFTFTALPSTIIHAGARPVLVEANPNYTMNVADLEAKFKAHPNCTTLILSHFRGKISDCDAIAALCARHGVVLIEDCAHGMGCTWQGKPAGSKGAIAVFSVQSDKVVNAGEGGFLVTDNKEYMARCVYWSGAYEKRYTYHLAAPVDEAELMEAAMLTSMNCSMRMTNLAGAMVASQMRVLQARVDHWNAMGAVLKCALGPVRQHLVVPDPTPGAGECFDHCVFSLPGFGQAQRDAFVDLCKERGVVVKPFGTAHNARFFKNWKFMHRVPDMPATEAIVRHAFDMKMPCNFGRADWAHVGAIMVHCVKLALGTREAGPAPAGCVQGKSAGTTSMAALVIARAEVQTQDSDAASEHGSLQSLDADSD